MWVRLKTEQPLVLSFMMIGVVFVWLIIVVHDLMIFSDLGSVVRRSDL